MTPKKSIVWFEEVTKDDIGLVGGKGANLGEMVNANFPIPYGFIITSSAYFDFVKENRLSNKIKDLLQIVNYENPHELQQASSHLRELISQSETPHYLVKQIVSYYEQLLIKEELHFKKKLTSLDKGVQTIRHLYDNPLVAIRSSATAEDLPGASFAGQQETFLNVKGETLLLKKIKDCWSSLFTERAIYYRKQQGFDHMKVGLAVVVQRMVQSDKSGIAFSVDPISADRNKIVIEAIYGLGEYIVGGKVTPDHYEVDKRSLVVTKKEIKKQHIMLKKYNNTNRELRLSAEQGKKEKLSDTEILKVALLVKDVENHYFFPQDIEWAIEKDRVYIVQSRPITTLKSKKSQESKLAKSSNSLPILVGSPASPGMGVGPVTIIFSPKEIHKINSGDILVAPQTNPDFVPAMRKAAAIVTEKGGRTSHAAIVSRELGIPAIVGADRATKLLKGGSVVTVNGSTGEIFKGGSLKPAQKTLTSREKEKPMQKNLKTVTKVYVNLAEPDQAGKIAKKDVDGVGLLRAEFMIAHIGIHPKEFIRKNQQFLFVNRLAKDLATFARVFYPRTITYRATDFRSNEYRNLKGGDHFEPHEENPMLGYRGAFRYVSNPEVFRLELDAIKKVYALGFDNLHLMIPFVRVPWELVKVKEIVQNQGLMDLVGFKLLIMVEVPACALNLEEFIKIGIDGVSVGTNDLTMMLLGVDRDNEEVASIYDERNPVVVNVLRNIIRTCTKYNVTSSICGQAASDYPELVEELVKEGITSVSVNPDAIERTREQIYEIEKKLFKNLKKGSK
ncbi:phosphoenolpyruvate synthase [Candidatus Roizmanbacteria bacterium]|nr:phosphoenolpyruvate synthase [Candidatus Roizmanbacteria bacterium]